MLPSQGIATHGNGSRELLPQESVHTLILAGNERVQDLIRQSLLPLQDALAEVRDIILKCEAELDVSEEVNVVIEPQRAVITVKRNTHFAKGK